LHGSPDLGSDVDIRVTGKLTRYNHDNTADVKLRPGRGRPHKIEFAKILDRPTGAPPPSSTVILVPEPSPPPSMDELTPVIKFQPVRPSFHLFSWGTFVAVLGMIVVGMFLEVGTIIFTAAIHVFY
jgi:hypothetical protein